MKKILICVASLMSFSTVAYAQEPVRDVTFYIQNQQELVKKFKQCQNNPGELRDTPNCVNAMAATFELTKVGKWQEPDNFGLGKPRIPQLAPF